MHFPPHVLRVRHEVFCNSICAQHKMPECTLCARALLCAVPLGSERARGELLLAAATSLDHPRATQEWWQAVLAALPRSGGGTSTPEILPRTNRPKSNNIRWNRSASHLPPSVPHFLPKPHDVPIPRVSLLPSRISLRTIQNARFLIFQGNDFSIHWKPFETP